MATIEEEGKVWCGEEVEGRFCIDVVVAQGDILVVRWNAEDAVGILRFEKV